MVTPRLFVGAGESGPAPGGDYALPAAAARHVAQALRMRAGDPVALFTGDCGEDAATIARIERRGVVVQVRHHEAIERESPWAVTLVQAIIAADMMDLVVRKAVELGVAAIQPVQAVRSQRLPPERAARRSAHWRQIAASACEQCGRNRVPDVKPVTSLSEWLDTFDVADGPLAILDAGAARSLAAAASPHVVVAGPEGGFAADELHRAGERGAVRVHLGGRVLRAETAAIVALATLNALAGDAK